MSSKLKKFIFEPEILFSYYSKGGYEDIYAFGEWSKDIDFSKYKHDIKNYQKEEYAKLIKRNEILFLDSLYLKHLNELSNFLNKFHKVDLT